jgi:Zn-dependent protease
MLLQEPGQTAYDLTFNLFGFEVRTNIFFFVLPLVFAQYFVSVFQNVNPGVALLTVAAVFWISTLAHELGHAFAFRRFGISSRIVLYWMGGLAIPEGSWMGRRNSLTPKQQIIVSLAGPIAGLLLAAVMVVLAISLKAQIAWAWVLPVPRFGETGPVPFLGMLHLIFHSFIVINVIMNLFNLVPVFPLDGGQVARQVLIQTDPWQGLRKSLILSMVAAIGMALISLQLMGSLYMAIFFGLMAFSNFQELQGPRW